MKRPLFFYGWVIAGLAGFSMLFVYGVRQSFSVFFPPILAEFGWSRGSTAFMFSLNLLGYGFTAPVVGNLADRWNAHRIMIIGVVLLSLAAAMCAFANKLWHFYLLFGVLVPVGMACCGWPILAPTLVNWFMKRKGLAMSIGQAGGGLSYTFGLLFGFVISNLGWRYSYLVLAGTIVMLLPVYVFLLRYRPEDKGLKRYGAEELTSFASAIVTDNKVKTGLEQEWTLTRALKSYRLWSLVISYAAFWGISCYLVYAHQIKFAEDVGYTTTFAAAVFVLFGIMMTLGNLVSVVSDWFGREKTVTIACILSIGALVALIMVKDTSQVWLLYLYTIFFGLGIGIYGPALFAGVADIFYGKHYAAINGIVFTGLGIGGVIGPWLGGYIYDVTGSYHSAFLLCIGCCVLSCIAFWIAAPRRATINR